MRARPESLDRKVRRERGQGSVETILRFLSAFQLTGYNMHLIKGVLTGRYSSYGRSNSISSRQPFTNDPYSVPTMKHDRDRGEFHSQKHHKPLLIL